MDCTGGRIFPTLRHEQTTGWSRRIKRLVIATILLLNIALIHKNRALEQGRREPPATIGVGSRVPTEITGVSALTGYGRVDLSGGGGGALLILFSVWCEICRESEQQLREVAGRAPAATKVVWVSRDPARDAFEYFLDDLPHGEFVADPSWRTYQSLTLHTVPQVLIVSGSGTVLHTWRGRVTETRRDEIVRTLMQDR
jgi:hypothetical protein